MELLNPESDAKRKRDVFLHVIKELLRVVPSGVNVALLCDREQDLAKEVAAWLDRDQWQAKLVGQPNAYDRIAGICYMNSGMSVQIQAADLVASLVREHGERRELDSSAPIDPLLPSH